MTTTVALPEEGQAVLVRGRPAAVRGVSAHGHDGEVTHLVDVEYLDAWDFPAEDSVLWEREIGAQVLKGGGLPRVDELPALTDPEVFAAFCDALRWSSAVRLPGLTSDGPALISPWESAVAPEPYQLVPVLRALEMPRVSLLLADDVGLGKTIEAGLVLRELLGRRRIRRVLVICPASLQRQWRDELQRKFALEFTIVDRAATVEIQREYGMDANPWAVTPRAIASMDFLRQPDVLSDFLAAADQLERGHASALDLLVVDEAHNLAPMGFSERSDRTKMLAEIALHAEHRLFLSATPHNGFTASFSGLLELLDPVRFRQTAELNDTERRQVDLVMVRRLKSELNARAKRRGDTPPFTERHVERIPFRWTPQEQRLTVALAEYRRAGTALLAHLGHRERAVGRFVFSLLTKRLLSCPYALARTWWSHIEGYATSVSPEEAQAAALRAEQQTADDEEKARREEDVARQGGGFLSRHERELAAARDEVSAALEALGWGREIVDEPLDPTQVDPSRGFPPDGKWEALEAWFEQRLRDGAKFKPDERAIWFTEYKDTLDYLQSRLVARGFALPEVRALFGGSSLAERAQVREAFNDAGDPVRLLVATDVAAEGLNLQSSCRYVVHYEVPWNPMRLDQRNGRVDRHGQARDVFCFHFASDDDADVRFLDYVVRKVEQVKDDLGSVGDVIDRAVEERFAETGHEVGEDELERRIETTLEQAAQRRDMSTTDEDEVERQVADVVSASLRELQAEPEALARLLSVAVRLDGGELAEAAPGLYRVARIPRGWGRTIDTSLRVESGPNAGALPRLAFDPDHLMADVGPRRVFRERSDTRLVRLAHPLMRRAAGALRRRLWEPDRALSRFTIAAADAVAEPVLVVPALLTLVNSLREPLHSELLTLAVGLYDRKPVAFPPAELTPLPAAQAEAWRVRLADDWDELAAAIEDALGARRTELDTAAQALLPKLLAEEKESQTRLYRRRLDELKADRGDAGRERLRRSIERLEAQARQLTFDPAAQEELEARLRRERQKLESQEYRQVAERRERLRARIERERERLLSEILPKRYELARADLLPVGLALAVPPGAQP